MAEEQIIKGALLHALNYLYDCKWRPCGYDVDRNYCFAIGDGTDIHAVCCHEARSIDDVAATILKLLSNEYDQDAYKAAVDDFIGDHAQVIAKYQPVFQRDDIMVRIFDDNTAYTLMVKHDDQRMIGGM